MILPAQLLFIFFVSLMALFVLSCALSHWLIALLSDAQVIDQPNMRSLHQRAVPRGGGLVFLLLIPVPLFVALIVMLLTEKSEFCTLFPEIIAFLPVLLLIGGVGWLDDRMRLSIQARLVVQLCCAIWAVIWLGHLDQIVLPHWFDHLMTDLTLSLGLFGAVLTVIAILWMINLYNFMDGLDGLAAGHSVLISATLAVWFYWYQDLFWALFCSVTAVVTLGFLFVNWAPAKVFMGDVGSTFLGMLFALLGLLAYTKHGLPLSALMILFGLFIADTTWTFLCRLMRGERVWEPHRQHFYQRAALLVRSHHLVTLISLVVGVILAFFATDIMLYIDQSLKNLFQAVLLLFTMAIWVVFREKIKKK